jgi:hypothetical protein
VSTHWPDDDVPPVTVEELDAADEGDQPQFVLVEDDEDVHYDGPDEPPVGREFYEETGED